MYWLEPTEGNFATAALESGSDTEPSPIDASHCSLLNLR